MVTALPVLGQSGIEKKLAILEKEVTKPQNERVDAQAVLKAVNFLMNYQCSSCTKVCCTDSNIGFPLDSASERNLQPNYLTVIDGTTIPTVKSSSQGCVYLGDSGCILGDEKPLYCSLWPFTSTI